MKTTGKIIPLLVLLALLFVVPTKSVAARGLMDGRVVFAGAFTLESGETLDGGLVVVFGTATIEEDSTVNGDIAVTGGSLVVDGVVNGNVVVVGGAVDLGAKSVINGDLTTVGAALDRAEGSQVNGEIFNTTTSWTHNGDYPREPDLPIIPTAPNVSIDFDPFLEAAGVLGRAVVMALLAMLVVMFLVVQTERVAQAVVTQPIVAGGLGLLTIIVALPIIVLLLITVLFIPVAVLAAILLALAIFYGWIAMGLEIGQRFVKAINQQWHPALAAGLGTFLLTLVVNGLSYVWCVGWPVLFLVIFLAVGGIIMTRFGTQAALPQAAITTVAVLPTEEKPVTAPADVRPTEQPDAPRRTRKTKKE